jgi:hypothetical protein
MVAGWRTWACWPLHRPGTKEEIYQILSTTIRYFSTQENASYGTGTGPVPVDTKRFFPDAGTFGPKTQKKPNYFKFEI